jgi:ribosomal protein S12 methylthiotransferase accessory factor
VTSSPAPARSLCRRVGVTRLARITGLDRTGVEVVAAVRPMGHVLQVSQGKGLDLASARWSALGEAAELAAAEAVDPAQLVWRETEAGLVIPFVRGVSLATGQSTWVPAQAVFCPPAGTAWLGPRVVPWSSNGLGFHPTSRRRAVTHAVLELLERHALARALPLGWTPAAARRRQCRPPALARCLGARGFAAFTFDLTLLGSVPVAGALLFDLEQGPIPLTAGYACRLTYEAAATAALLEAAQSRLTEIHGAREDVLLGAREAGRALLTALEAASPRRPPPSPWRRPLAEATGEPISLVTLSGAAEPGARTPWVVKAYAPSLAVSELL